MFINSLCLGVCVCESVGWGGGGAFVYVIGLCVEGGGAFVYVILCGLGGGRFVYLIFLFCFCLLV